MFPYFPWGGWRSIYIHQTMDLFQGLRSGTLSWKVTFSSDPGSPSMGEGCSTYRGLIHPFFPGEFTCLVQ
jgi:hypothetical protein